MYKGNRNRRAVEMTAPAAEAENADDITVEFSSTQRNRRPENTVRGINNDDSDREETDDIDEEQSKFSI